MEKQKAGSFLAIAAGMKNLKKKKKNQVVAFSTFPHQKTNQTKTTYSGSILRQY